MTMLRIAARGLPPAITTIRAPAGVTLTTPARSAMAWSARAWSAVAQGTLTRGTLAWGTLARAALAWAALAFATPLLLPVAPAAAQALSELSCQALWYQRNAVYAEQGHCFKTADAVATFGARCYPPYGKLTPDQQRYVDQVRYWEARKGCR